MLVRIVACRNDNTSVTPLLHRQKGHSRRRDGAQQHHIAAHGTDTCTQGRFQHIRGDAGILTDGDANFPFQFFLQNSTNCLTYLIGQLCCKILTRNTADAVCTEQFCHRVTPLITVPTVSAHQNPCADAHRRAGSRSGRGVYALRNQAASNRARRHPPASPTPRRW